MRCIRCGGNVADARAALGVNTCLRCGDKAADQEILAKRNRVAVAYNKGGLMYLGDPSVAAQTLRDTMGAQGRSVATLAFTVSGTSRSSRRTKRKAPPKSLGIMWVKGQPQYIFTEDQPMKAGAERYVFFADGK